MTVTILIAMLLFIAPGAAGQSPDGAPGPSPGGAEGPPGGIPSPGLDSLNLRLALLEIAKADREIEAAGFWHRLVPKVSVNGGIGVRDIAFTDGTGSLVLPKESYRLTVALSLSDLFDGSVHARAELEREEAEVRYLLIARKQSLARLALLRKRDDLAAELAALRAELVVRSSLAAFQELLFIQGRVDFKVLSESKIELIRLKHTVAGLSSRLRETERTIAGEAGE